MKFGNFALYTSIFALCAGDAISAAPSRARPGSITGAVMSRSMPQQAQAPAAIPAAAPAAPAATAAVASAPVSPAIAAMSSMRYSPITNNALREITDENGNTVWVDPANDNRFAYDINGNLVKLPDNPDDYIIPTLGVTVRTARAACTGIFADEHQGIFDETSYQCLIPVVAHNWGGIIKSDGEDVVAWAPMGEMLKCSGDAFEQVSGLRRSSKWVVPVMIGGGAGIGTLIGWRMDVGREKREEAERLAREKAVNDREKKIREEVDAAMEAEIKAKLAAAGEAPVSITYNGRTYWLTGEKNDLEALMAVLKDDIKPFKTGSTGALGKVGDAFPESELQEQLKAYDDNIKICLQESFMELVSTGTCTSPKMGRIKITKTNDGCIAGTSQKNERIYCWYDVIHKSISSPADCSYNGNNDGRDTQNKSLFPENGQCYYRDEITKYDNTSKVVNQKGDELGTAVDLHQNITGAPTINTSQPDATISSDLHRWKTIESFGRICPDALLSKTCEWVRDTIRDFSADPNPDRKDTETGHTLGSIKVYSKNPEKTFNSAIGNSNLKNCICKGITGVPQQTIEKALSQLGALIEVNAFYQNIKGKEVRGIDPEFDVNLGKIKSMLETAKANYEALAKLDADIKSSVGIVFDKYGVYKEEEPEKKGFFEKSIGKGLLIGTGIGAAAGLGYFFAEGASVFCNVGGMEQVKMNRSYLIPTFREYLLKRNYLK